MNAIRLSLLSAFSLLTAVCFAQVDRGTIVGTVTDQNSAVIPGAVVMVTNSETRQTVKLATNETGGYIAGSLLIGNYSVSAEKTGFQKILQPNVRVDVNKVVRVDLSL